VGVCEVFEGGSGGARLPLKHCERWKKSGSKKVEKLCNAIGRIIERARIHRSSHGYARPMVRAGVSLRSHAPQPERAGTVVERRYQNAGRSAGAGVLQNQIQYG